MKAILLLGIVAGLGFSGPAFAQQPKANQQLQKANEGQKARDHVFDGRPAPAPAVRANPAPKPSMVGVSTKEFKPAQKPLKITEPPKPR
jgi:hypothetical protein